jgi:metacaspase-1
MIRLTLIRAVAAAGLALAACTALPAQDDRCGAGHDLVVRALERVTPSSSDDAFEDSLQLLKHAVQVCGELGDAWYYRSLVEQRLGHTALAQYAQGKAREFGSEALQQELNPFVLATPAPPPHAAPAATPRGGTARPAPLGTAPPAPAAGPVQQKWALVIGISRFGDRAVPSLHFSTADANAFATELKDPAVGRFPTDNVHVLLDDQATTRNIREQLNWIARHAQPNDLVVIYVATHGSPHGLDTVGGASYIITYDTEIDDADKPNEDALYATALPMVDLANAVATRMKAMRTAVILDTCFSGSAAGHGAQMMGAGVANAAPSQAMLDRMSQGTGRIVLAASASGEESLESPQLEHGYFTYFLLQSLKTSGGLTPLSQVYSSVAQQVEQRVKADGLRDQQLLEQHPVMSRSSEDADFALGVTAAGGSAAPGGR